MKLGLVIIRISFIKGLLLIFPQPSTEITASDSHFSK
jgi:hypothetical protein